MEQELLSVIKDKLPESTSGVLKEYLAKAERTEKLYKDSLDKVTQLNKELSEVKAENSELRALNNCRKALEQRAQEMTVKEMAYERDVMKIQKEAAEKSMHNVYELTSLVFKNPRLSYSENYNTGSGYFSKSGSSEEIK